MLSRKHYVAIAAKIRQYGESMQTFTLDYEDAIVSIASDLADYFEEDNPNFDRERFLTACGVTHE